MLTTGIISDASVSLQGLGVVLITYFGHLHDGLHLGLQRHIDAPPKPPNLSQTPPRNTRCPQPHENRHESRIANGQFAVGAEKKVKKSKPALGG